MAVKRINITYLLEGGKRLSPVDLIVDYRFKVLTDKEVRLLVWGITNNKGYTCLGHQNLFKPIHPNDKLINIKDFNTDIFQLKIKEATGLFIEILNHEYVEIKRIDFTFNECGKLSGRVMDCGPYYPPIPEIGFNVNSFVFSYIPVGNLDIVNPFVFTEEISFIVNPFVVTEVEKYNINPLVTTEHVTFNIDPFVLSIFKPNNVNPFVFKEYELMNVNPLVFTVGFKYNDSLMWISDLISEPVNPNDSLMWISEQYVPTSPAITKVGNLIIME